MKNILVAIILSILLCLPLANECMNLKKMFTSTGQSKEAQKDHRLLSSYESHVAKNFPDPEVQKFLKTFQPPNNILLSLIKQQNNFTHDQKNLFTYLPQQTYNDDKSLNKDFYLKQDYVLSRVICAKRIKNLTKQKGYSSIDAPDKYLILTNNGRSLLCAAQKITATDEPKVIIDLDQMREFCDVVQQTRFCDWNSGNFIIQKNTHTIYPIDTEIRSFSHGKRNNADTNIKQLAKYIMPGEGKKAYFGKTEIEITPKAKEYLTQLLSDLGNLPSKKEISSKSLTQMHELDESEFNFKRVHPSIDDWILMQPNTSKREVDLVWYTDDVMI